MKKKLIRRGKVRDIYALNDSTLLIETTDRISAFDSVLPTEIPGKGFILGSITRAWIRWLKREFPSLHSDQISYTENETVVRKLDVYPVEFVVRGYITGSGWKDYQKTGKVQGVKVGDGLQESDRLRTAIFTPTTKEDDGHDEPLTWGQYRWLLGEPLASRLRNLCVAMYERARDHMESKGILLADTKFEWGHDGSKPVADSDPVLIDEVLTPDSSRYWDAATWKRGKTPHSFDKQFVRDYLKSIGWTGGSEPPELPPEIVEQTLERYQAIDKIISGIS